MLQQDTDPGKVPRVRMRAGLTHLLVTINSILPHCFPLPRDVQCLPISYTWIPSFPRTDFTTLTPIPAAPLAGNPPRSGLPFPLGKMHLGISEAKLHVHIGSSSSSYPAAWSTKATSKGTGFCQEPVERSGTSPGHLPCRSRLVITNLMRVPASMKSNLPKA